MSKDYIQMWESLGLNLEAHDGLLEVLGKQYREVFLKQQNRPEGMGYFDFVMREVHGLRVKELLDAQAHGRKVIGTFCVYAPEELILAANAICVGLCAGAEIAPELADEYLPRNTCALIRSFFGFKLAGVCPYTNACDLVVGETTCDGKKKAYEIFAELKDLYVMEIPQRKGAADRVLWRAEIVRFKERVEQLTGVEITADRLRAAITTVNDRRRALQRLTRLRYQYPTVISGRDALLINQIAFYDDPARFTGSVNALCDELEQRGKDGVEVASGNPVKLMIAGCPMAVPNWKLPVVVEEAGAVIVAEESCVGERNTRDLVVEEGGTVADLVDRLTDRYMSINCAVFTPNEGRLDHVVETARAAKVDGIIHYALQFCGPYTIEARNVQKRLDAEGLPLLRLETDYGAEDTGQLKTRVEAFVEQLS
ncbi:MAG: 3-hydroxyacyl-ACP dehydratase [Armatimonadetes bacterium CG17_big_fil_post_rev_8_21_14_2_50_66_6]|nr:MAG: 3-hydroxyacyl-ACP dehydratase [Armatimonadetes bacterium CG17_big_fil_post_rev_8_21_14_2_50_66_6]